MRYSTCLKFVFAALAMASAACQKPVAQPEVSLPSTLGGIPAARLNYRYEADVPPPEVASQNIEELHPAVERDFRQNRTDEILDRTLTSPDKKRVLAIYHLPGDLQSEFRLDMYDADGRLLAKLTSDMMAVHFPDTIVWSPDSAYAAFVAMIRSEKGTGPETAPTPAEVAPDPASKIPGDLPQETNPEESTEAGANENVESDPANASPLDPLAGASPTPTAPTGILAFRTEQIYIADAEGGNLKPLTQNEGLIYFYYVWSPRGNMLAALAATTTEWDYLQKLAESKQEIFVPLGRPRLIELTGRERRLDDGLTAVRPVWSPDSTKIAAAFDTQIRVYDADGNPPTQAAIPLRNSLLLSSQAFDRAQEQKLNAENAAEESAEAPSQAPPASPSANESPASTLPDPGTLVSFNPIVALEWESDQILYFQTAFIKRMLNEADSVSSFPRWHRVVLSPQPVVINKQEP